MQLIELSQSDKYHYNRFVANQPSGSFLQSWDWGQWQESLGRKVFRFFIKDGNSNVIASVQLIRMPLPGKKCYLYAPYGPVLAKSENPQFTIFNFQTLARELEKKFLEAVFIRVEPKVQIPELQSAAKKSLHIQPISTLVIDLSNPQAS